MVKIALVSGYKAQELGIFKQNHPSIHFIKMAIKRNLEVLLDEGLEWVIISGQLGTEIWTAEVVFDLQIEGYSDLKLAVITPFLNQEKNWSEANKELYESVISKADFVDSITKKEYESPSQFRIKNQFLIEKSDLLILFYDEEKEGSPKYLFQTAKEYGERNEADYEVRLISFYDLQVLVEEENEWGNN
ncbi:DUF1273 domain-containing protein [Bacillus massilinigeriensis]|uniref:DUF1273 domain-containing protein n=1 Tax=Bacillus massilionigeriensis TaxID=1805475 RepID=UPI00096B5165|nr:DUF1273 domain-containing protein [Bacillus massilionigeriensis]